MFFSLSRLDDHLEDSELDHRIHFVLGNAIRLDFQLAPKASRFLLLHLFFHAVSKKAISELRDRPQNAREPNPSPIGQQHFR
jgi:hypothetical protein